MATESEINAATDEFEKRAKECEATPAEVNDNFDTLITIIEGGSLATFPLTGGLSVVAGWLTTSWIDDNRQEIINAIDAILKKLKEAAEGLAAPILFLGYSNDWGSAKNCATDALTAQYGQTTQMFGTWEGKAADQYRNARDSQYRALKSMETLSQDVSKTMATLATAGWTLYTKIAKLVLDFITDVAAAAAKIPTIISTGDGVSDAIDLTTGLLDDLVDLLAATGDFIFIQQQEVQAMNGWASSLEGIPNGHWPEATSKNFDNGTVTDGVNSWSVKYG